MKKHCLRASIAVMAILILAKPSFAQQLGANQGLKVLSATPRGSTQTRDQSRTIVVMFNKPMVALQAVPVDESSGPLVLEPPVRGKYRWLGTSTLTFVPTDTLPFSTAFTARVAAGTKALDGTTLNQDFVWTFETPRPQLVRSLPSNGSSYVVLHRNILLLFNQPVDPYKLSQYVYIYRQDGENRKFLPFDIRQTQWGEEDWFNPAGYGITLIPRENFEVGSRYVVQLKAGLPGAIGNLGMAADQFVSFTTQNEFKFLGLQGTAIRPDAEIWFTFSNPVQMKELATHLKFEPHIEIPDEYIEGWYSWSSTGLSLRLPLLPDTTYTFTIDSSMKDTFNNSLGIDVTGNFTTLSQSPRLYMAGGDGTLEAYGQLRYPVRVRNVDTVRLRMASIPLDSVVLSMTGRIAKLNYSVDREWVLHTKRNQYSTVTFNAGEALSGKGHGFVIAELTNPLPKPADFGTTRTSLQITGLGITGKYSPENNLVWVTRLKNTEPVKGATIQLRDDQSRILWTGKTDDAGLARTPGWGQLGMKPGQWQQPRVWIFAIDGDDFAFTKSEDGTGIDPWRFGVDYEWQPQYQPVEGALFTDRGLYRTGESVQIKGIIRKRVADNWVVQNGAVAVVTVSDPMGEQVESDSLRLSEYGSFDLTVKIKPTAHLGYYRITVFTAATGLEYSGGYYEDNSVKTPQGMIRVASDGFRVEAFRPAESEVTVRFMQPEYIMGDTISANVLARYLFGAPMRKDKVSWKLRSLPGYYDPPGHPGFSFSPIWWQSNRSESLLASADTVLDERGMLSLSYPVQAGKLTGTKELLLEATATSPSRRSVTSRATAIIHGAHFYIGTKISRYFLKHGDTLNYDLIAVRPDGKSSPGQQMRVRLIKRQWISVRRAEVDGRYYWQTDRIDTTMTEHTVTSRDSAVSEKYVPPTAGYYFIIVDGKDSLGNYVTCGADFYVTGSGYVAWERSDDDRIELVADREKYVPGDVARVMVKSPYEKARALVTLERDGILDQWTTELVGSAPELKIPITKMCLPNIYVSVVLLQGRVSAQDVTNREEDVGRPSFKIGYVNLTVDPGTHHLKVAVSTDKEEYHPGDSVEVSVSVKNAAGAGTNSEVVISVADMGVLNLINYELRDPFLTFFSMRALAVSTSETIVHLVEQRSYGEKGEDEGGGGTALSEIQMRGDFKLTAYWNPSVITDDSGKTKVKFKLPDNLSRFKVMAVAQTKGSEFGAGNSTFRVNKEFLVQGALPRFARVGDAFNAGVVAMNYSKVKSKVLMQASVEGDVRIIGKKTAEFELDAGESREVRFDYIASSVAGSAKFNFQAAMGKFTDGLTMTIPITVPRLKESVALYESTKDTASQALVIPKDIYPMLGGIQLTAASTALCGLENSVDYLFTYPYGCLEQRLSGALPLIFGEEIVKAFNLPALQGKNLRRIAQKVIDEVPSFMTSEGGFAYWKGDSYSYPYLSGYALYALAVAKEHGYSIDQNVLKRAIDYCSGFLRKNQDQSHFPWDEHSFLATKALMVYSLALLGHPEPAYIEQLFTIRDKLPLFARAFLLEAIDRTSRNPDMENTIVGELMNTVKVASTTAHFEEPNWEGLRWTFSSNTRTTAIILRALIRIGNRDQFLGRVVRWLMEDQKVGRWRSTQENIYVVSALADYFDAFENETPDFKTQIKIAGKNVLDAVFKGRELKTISTEQSLDSFQKDRKLPVRIEKSGTGILYYGIRMNYYPTRDTLARDEGIAVIKTISTVNGKAVPHDSVGNYVLSAGSMYKVTLRIVIPQQRNFIVVDDPLPAGTEAVNLTFDTESDFLSRNVSGDNWESMYWNGGFNHVEQKDDRVLLFATTLSAGVHDYSYLVRAATYGTFRMPATHAEQMYEPDVFGQTVQRIVIVR